MQKLAQAGTIGHRGMGWRPDTPDLRDHYYAARFYTLTEAAAPPAHVDLRSQFPGVYDQLQTSSCTGNATAAAIEHRLRVERKIEFVPSRLFPYYNAREMENDAASDAGAEIRDVIKSVATYGVCSESPRNNEATWPFDQKKVTTKPTPDCYTVALKDIISQYARVQQNIDQMQAVLAEGYGIVLGVSLYESFESQAVANTGTVQMPGTREKMIGGHAVVAVGYDVPSQRFIMRNSWGPDWGDGGYFTMPFDYLTNTDLCDDLWIIRAA
jgi:C1A family cysteine protease